MTCCIIRWGKKRDGSVSCFDLTRHGVTESAPDALRQGRRLPCKQSIPSPCQSPNGDNDDDDDDDYYYYYYIIIIIIIKENVQYPPSIILVMPLDQVLDAWLEVQIMPEGHGS